MPRLLLGLIGLFSLFLLFPVTKARADSYSPKKGEPFMFYPVAPAYKQMAKGYDCFYNPDQAFVEGHTQPLPQHRFKADANGLTPFCEIEGHTFIIVSAMKENPDKSVSQQNYLCFLQREDGARLLLRIPFVRKPSDNVLVRGMALVLNEKNSARKGSGFCTINIPACPVSEYETLRKTFGGQRLVRDNSKSPDETVLILTQYLDGKDMAEGIFRISSEMQCDSVTFAKVNGYVFMQPLAFCNLRGRRVQIPVFDFRGNGESYYGSNFSMNSYFKPKINVSPVVPVVAEKKEPEVVVEKSPAVVKEEPKPVIPTPPVVVEKKEPEVVVEKTPVAVKEDPKQVAPKNSAEETEKERYARLTKSYGAKNAKLMMAGTVQKGFTKDMVKEVMGEPDFINVTQNMYTTLEQWVYGHDKFLYFQKDKLQSMEDF